MELLYFPPSLRHFEALPSPGGPFAPAPLEYDLVEALRPRITVDLGTGEAGAFFSLCQSARDHDVDGLFHAVDEWADDSQREPESPYAAAAINNFMHSHFRGIAYLLRVSPEEALRHFPEGSIDLLRIDASRLQRPLAPILESYGPRVAVGGVVVGAGLSERDGSLTAWSSFTRGAGVVVEGNDQLGFVRLAGSARAARENDLLRLLSTGTEADRAALGRFYAHARGHHALRREVQSAPNLFRKKA